MFQMMDPRITTRRMGFDQFRSFLRNLDIKVSSHLRDSHMGHHTQTSILVALGSESEVQSRSAATTSAPV